MIKFTDFVLLKEEAEKTVVFNFGRMNPVTVGHLKLMDKLVEVAKEHHATPFLFLSHTQDKKKNPLSYEQKIKYARSNAPKGLKIIESPARNVAEVLKELQKIGVKKVLLVVGSDRVEQFSMWKKYPDDFDMESIDVVSAGERDPDSDDIITSISGSKMREYAKEGDFQHFKSGAGCSKDLIQAMYDDVRKGLGISSD